MVPAFSAFFCYFSYRCFMFRTAQKSPQILSVGAPCEYVQQKRHEHDRGKICVVRRAVARNIHGTLPDCKAGSADQRSHRAPFRNKNIQRDQHEKSKTQGKKPRIFAREPKPESSQRGSDTFSASEFIRYGENMPDHHKQPRRIPHQIGDTYFRTRKNVSAKDIMAHKRGNTALERIAEKRNHADFPAEFAAHIHRSGVSAADFRDVPMFLFRDKTREIKTPDEIAHRRDNQYLIPFFRK